MTIGALCVLRRDTVVDWDLIISAFLKRKYAAYRFYGSEAHLIALLWVSSPLGEGEREGGGRGAVLLSVGFCTLYFSNSLSRCSVHS